MLMLSIAAGCGGLYTFLEEKSEEVIDLRFEAVNKRIDYIHEEQERQWEEISNNSHQ